MQVDILEEAGYNTALYGFSLSYKDRAIPREEWWGNCFDCMCKHNNATMCDGVIGDSGCKQWSEKRESKQLQTTKTATANAGRGMGHDKWLRQVVLWIDIEAPRYWWSEFDTYKVGTVAQSESTMHTLSRRDMNVYDLEQSIEQDIQQEQVACFNKAKGRYINSIGELKKYVPESYLQRRVVSLSYAVLRCIIEQRKNHKLPEWKVLIDALYAQCEHPELLPRRD